MLMEKEKKSDKQSLPPFRKDIKLFRGPDDPDGSPTYSLYDPVVGKYYKISWQESLVFRHYKPGMDPETLADTIQKLSAVKLEAKDVEAFFGQLGAAGLLNVHRDSTHYAALKERSEQGWLMWLVYHYLYIRIPVLNPDKFLSRTMKYFEFLGSKSAIICYLIAGIIGLYLTAQRWDEFLNTFTYFFNIEGALFYGVGISITKLIHEFSHAYVAKHYRLYVPSMGIAVIVLWPVLYTDVTEGWRLSSRRERLLISFAGVAAELVVAAFATIGWALSPPGLLQSMFFVLSTTSLLSTLLVNLNPAVRFDGYYMLCDIWGIDNLQNRAFAVTRWKYFDWFFGVKTSPPEEGLSPSRIVTMFVYTIYTWGYRIFLYTAIALFVYYEFTKALGIVLFIAEVVIFMIWPIWYEISELYKVKHLLNLNKRLQATLFFLFLIAVYFFLPWPHKISFDAVVVPIKEQIVWVPLAGKVERIDVKRGQEIKKGQEIVVIESLPLEKEIIQANLDKDATDRKLFQMGLEDETTQYLSQMQGERSLALAKLAKLHGQKHLMFINADFNGKLYTWDIDLKVGQNVSEGMVLGKIADFSKYAVKAFVSENQISYFKVGQTVSIEISHPLTFVQGKVMSIDPYSSSKLLYPSLASSNFGPLPIVEQRPGQLDLLESYYVVFVEIESDNIQDVVRIGQNAQVSIRGPWVSNAAELLRKVMQVLIRESSL